MNPLLLQVQPTFVTLEVPVTKLTIYLKASAPRTAWRTDHGISTGAIAVRWFMRLLRLTGWRYIEAAALTVSWSNDTGEDFIRNLETWRVRARVLLPPAAPFPDDVTRLHTNGARVIVPLQMPAQRALP